jgi:hypothetical protein
LFISDTLTENALFFMIFSMSSSVISEYHFPYFAGIPTHFTSDELSGDSHSDKKRNPDCRSLQPNPQRDNQRNGSVD